MKKTTTNLFDQHNNNPNYLNFYRKIEKLQLESLSPTDISSGLYSNDIIKNAFILTDFSIKTEINDTCSTQIWTQKYDNRSSLPIEGKYKLPLHPNSVISNFLVEYKDQVKSGKIKEKNKALEKYSDGIANGDHAFLGEKTDDGYFNLMIGNLPPKEKVTIRIVITSELGVHLNSLHYFIHNSMFPKSNGFSFDLNIKLRISTPIKSISLDQLANHTLTFDSDDKKEATITSNSQIGGSNILIIIEPTETDTPKSIIEYNSIDKSYALAINFNPNFFKDIKSDEINQKSEFIFLVDCSGSMNGKAILKSKRALKIIIRSLSETHKINIYCFGSRFKKAFPSSRLYNDHSLKEVSKFIDKNVFANLLGTELMEPLKDIFSTPVDIEYPRQVFILTDGEVSERDTLIDYVSKESNTTRIFTLGIGNSVDKELIIGLSSACGGYYTLIQKNNQMEKKVMELLNISFEPMLSNIKVDWSSFGLLGYNNNNNYSNDSQINEIIIQAPLKIRPLFNKERMIIYSLLPSNNSTIETIIEQSMVNKTPITITLTCDGPMGNQLSFPIALDFNKTITNTLSVHTLAAFKYIQDLEESESKEKKDNKNKIVELGKKYGLVSKYTSFILNHLSEQEVTNESMIIIDILKQRLLDGCYGDIVHSCKRGGSRGVRGGSRGGFSGSGSSNRGGSILGKTLLEYEDTEHEPTNGIQTFDSNEIETYKKRSLSQQKIITSTTTISTKKSKSTNNTTNNSNGSDLLIDLLKCQKANGSWTKSSISKFNFSTSINKNIPTELSTNSDTLDIWTTIYIIAKITKLFISEKYQYELSIQKSIKWVKLQLSKSNITNTKSFDELLSTAKSIV